MPHKSQIHSMMKTTHALKPQPSAESAPAFPRTRMRRNRRTEWMRRLIAEHQVTVDDLIWPVFVTEGKNQIEPVASMPGVSRFSLDVLVKEIEAAAKLGIPAVALFPVVPAPKETA